MTDTPFRSREQRHRRRGERGETDPELARGWTIAADQRPRRLDHDEHNKQRVGAATAPVAARGIAADALTPKRQAAEGLPVRSLGRVGGALATQLRGRTTVASRRAGELGSGDGARLSEWSRKMARAGTGRQSPPLNARLYESVGTPHSAAAANNAAPIGLSSR
jgi:hypothetical protein